jgi:uncharacterized protein DUF7007
MLQRELIPEAIQTSDDIKAHAGPLPTACVDETCDCPALPDNPKAGVQLTDGTYACWGCIEVGLLQTVTPWGEAIHQSHLADGIDYFETGGHGGYRVSVERIKEMQPDLVTARWFHVSKQPGAFGELTKFDDHWFEHDCEACKVALTWPDLFPRADMLGAHDMVKQYWPKQLAAFMRSRRSTCAKARIDVDTVRQAFKPGTGFRMTDVREICQLSAQRARDAVRILVDKGEFEKIGSHWARKEE